jgi:molybdopterin converting factor small subunit
MAIPATSAGFERVLIRVLAFARLRELLAGKDPVLELPEGACVADAWDALTAQCPALAELSASTRFARNGRLTEQNEPLADGDELALLPPVGGG